MRHGLFFSDWISKPIVAAFAQARSSSDGSGLLLKEIDEGLGLSEKLASRLRDEHEPGKVGHEIQEPFRQRMFAIARDLGDCDAARGRADDPIHKILVGRTPVSGDPLASTSTLSRFENAVCVGEPYRLVETIGGTLIGRHRRCLGHGGRAITLDFGPTDDPTDDATYAATMELTASCR